MFNKAKPAYLINGISATGQAMPTKEAKAKPCHVPSKSNQIISANAKSVYASMLSGTPALNISALSSMNNPSALFRFENG